MNFASVLEKRYEHSRFAHFYTNNFALIRESFALIREIFALFRESFALFRVSYALIREKYNFFLYENEPNRLSYVLNILRVLKYKVSLVLRIIFRDFEEIGEIINDQKINPPKNYEDNLWYSIFCFMFSCCI